MRGELCQHSDLLVRTKDHDIFQRFRFVWSYRSTTSCSRLDLEIDKMDVNGMAPSSTLVLEFPEFNFSAWGICEDTVGNVFESDVIDQPLAITGHISMISVAADYTYLRSKRNDRSTVVLSIGGRCRVERGLGTGPLFAVEVTAFPTLNRMTRSVPA